MLVEELQVIRLASSDYTAGAKAGLATVHNLATSAISNVHQQADQYKRELQARALEDLLKSYSFFHSEGGHWPRISIEQDIIALRSPEQKG